MIQVRSFVGSQHSYFRNFFSLSSQQMIRELLTFGMFLDPSCFRKQSSFETETSSLHSLHSCLSCSEIDLSDQMNYSRSFYHCSLCLLFLIKILLLQNQNSFGFFLKSPQFLLENCYLAESLAD
jgi:hypothetical protein